MKTKLVTPEKWNTYFELLRFLVAILIALAISLIIISFSNNDPLRTISNLFIGPFTSVRRFSTVLEKMIPLTFSGLAVCIMFKANQFNLAAEGALFFGALISAMIAVCMPGPAILVKITAIVAAGLAGAFVTMIPGILKIKWKCNEMVISLMLNYVMLYFSTFLFNQTIKDSDSAYKTSFPFQEGVILQNIIPKTRLHSGIFIVAIIVVLVYIFIYKTQWGYKLRVTGSNVQFAQCSGIKVAGVILMSQILGGMIAGIGGGVEMLGIYNRFQWSSLPGYGFDGVVINILARENPAFIPVAAFFVSFVRIGADYMYKQSDVAAEIVAIIEGLVIILVAASAFLASWKHKMTTKLSKELLRKDGE